MNEQYLCRGKRLDSDHEWVVGYLIVGFTGINYIVTKHDHILGVTEMYEVDPATVGRCTGLRDKRGKLIFEGDIIHDKFFNENAMVFWKYGAWMLKFSDIAEYLDEYARECKVVGNARDNQELVGGQDGD